MSITVSVSWCVEITYDFMTVELVGLISKLEADGIGTKERTVKSKPSQGDGITTTYHWPSVSLSWWHRYQLMCCNRR